VWDFLVPSRSWVARATDMLRDQSTNKKTL
jgi:hypothetical protein